MPSQIDNWDQHWQLYARSAEDNPAQRYRRQLVFDLLGSPTRFLDVGSGQGDLSADVQRAYPQSEILGLELSDSGVSISRRKVPAATFLQRDLLEPGAPPQAHTGWATHAVCSEVLEHVDDPQVFLRNLAPYLAPNCRLVVTVPGGPMSAFDRHIGHRRHFTGSLLRNIAESAGFRVETVWQAGFPFFNLYRLTVILRGKALIQDVAENQSGGKMSGFASLMMAVFRLLFVLNLRNTPMGWQLAAVLRKV